MTCASSVVTTAVLLPSFPSSTVKVPGVGFWLVAAELGGRLHPSVRGRRREPVQERAPRERAEVAGPQRRHSVDRGDRETDAERARPDAHGSGSSRSIGLVAYRGGQTTAYSPGACHCHTTLLARTFAPAVTVPGSPNRNPLPLGSEPSGRSTAFAAVAIAAAANAVDLPQGSLPNGSGLRFGEPGTVTAGANVLASSVVWQWQAPGEYAVVWPPRYATSPIERLDPLP